jgi:hypothetical protein
MPCFDGFAIFVDGYGVGFDRDSSDPLGVSGSRYMMGVRNVQISDDARQGWRL